MNKDLIVSNCIIGFYILQRITELAISRENELWLRENCQAREVSKIDGLKMKIFHSLWFLSLLIETNYVNQPRQGIEVLVAYIILAIGMGIRFYTIEKLKKFWTIKIFSLNKQTIFHQGIYKFVRHPNYVVVMVEFLLIPFLFNAYFTLIGFSILNLFLLNARVQLEEKTMREQSNYEEVFKGVKKFIPYVVMLAFMQLGSVNAKELSINSSSFSAAKNSNLYLRFEGESTKLGLVTTKFEGYAKEFKIKYDLIDDNLKTFDVEVLTSKMDTDLIARNEKMIESILGNLHFPKIHAKLTSSVLLKEGTQTINMLIKIKDKSLIKAVVINVALKEKKYLISGQSILGLKEFNLPDPSIIIAKVKDDIKLDFYLVLEP